MEMPIKRHNRVLFVYARGKSSRQTLPTESGLQLEMHATERLMVGLAIRLLGLKKKR